MIITHDDYEWHCAIKSVNTYKVVITVSDYEVLELFKLQKYFIGRKYSIPFENIEVYTTAEPAILYHVYNCFESYRDKELAIHKLNQIRLFYGKNNVCLAKCTVPMESLYIDYDGILISDNIVINKLIFPKTLYNENNN